MFQQSQFSEQKNQSGFKLGINYNEQIANMTIKMMKQLKISTFDKNEILYYDKPITLIQLVARSDSSNESDGKGYININDDSGQLKLILLFCEGVQIREMYNIVQQDEPKIIYFQFLLRARINKDAICFDVMNIKKLNQVGYQISHMLNIIQQQIKTNQKREPNLEQTNTLIDEEVQQKQSEQNLSRKILNFIKAQTHQLGSISITQQSIFNAFSETFNLQEIKQSIKLLLDDGNISSGQGINTYMLVD
ncbi:unnamed protein product [Paramecium pentaurelia]|uniref:Uncharacterized protein n=1 Tax=Paramecium pentaurelia TaxID=43138 RepID=A0A8S1TF55_9CILI|nr:unnamed protein product [Paramecium pentaurelia]